MQIGTVTRLARINPIVGIVLNKNSNEPQYQSSATLKSKIYSSQTRNNINGHHNYHTYVRLNSHIRATKIEDPTQTHNNRISWRSIIIIDNYWGTGHYEEYCSQLRPTASAGCNISHNAMCLSNYPLNSSAGWLSRKLIELH